MEPLQLAYLASLLVSMAGMLVIDLRWRVALAVEPVRTLIAVAAPTLVLLVWDLVAIEIGLFRIGESPGMTGIELGPHMPIEEPIFLVFLSYLSIVLWRLAMRIPWGGRAPRSDAAADAAATTDASAVAAGEGERA